MQTKNDARRSLVEKVIRASPYLVMWEEITEEVSRVVLDATSVNEGIALITLFPKKMVIQNAMKRTWRSVSYDDSDGICIWLKPLVGTIKNSRLLGLI